MLLISGVFAGPAAAQEDERFYGDWWPYSGGTGNNLLSIEPGGTILFIPPTGETTVERYVVIRDFGKRVLVRLWSLAEHPVEQQNDTLVVLELDDSFDPEIIDRLYLRHYFLRYYYCSGPTVDRFFSGDPGVDEIWRRIVEWSAISDKADPGRECRIPEGKIEGEGWGWMVWSR